MKETMNEGGFEASENDVVPAADTSMMSVESEFDIESSINIEDAINYDDEETPSPIVGMNRDRANTSGSLIVIPPPCFEEETHNNGSGGGSGHCKRLFSVDDDSTEKENEVKKASKLDNKTNINYSTKNNRDDNLSKVVAVCSPSQPSKCDIEPAVTVPTSLRRSASMVTMTLSPLDSCTEQAMHISNNNDLTSLANNSNKNGALTNNGTNDSSNSSNGTESPPTHLKAMVRGQLKGSKSMSDLTVLSNHSVSGGAAGGASSSLQQKANYDRIELLFAQTAKISSMAADAADPTKRLKTMKDVRTEQLLSQAIQFHAENQDPTTSGYFTTETAAAITRSANKFRTNACTPMRSTAKAPATETDFSCEFVGYKLNEIEQKPVTGWFTRSVASDRMNSGGGNGTYGKNNNKFYVDYIINMKIRDSSYMEHAVQCVTHRPFSNHNSSSATNAPNTPTIGADDNTNSDGNSNIDGGGTGNDGIKYNTLLDLTVFRRYSEFHQLHLDILSELKLAMINYGYNGSAVNCQPIIDQFRTLFPPKKTFYSYAANLPHLYSASTNSDKISANESFHLQRKFDLHHWFMHVIETISRQYRAHRFNSQQHLRKHKLKPLAIQISHNTLDAILKHIIRFCVN